MQSIVIIADDLTGAADNEDGFILRLNGSISGTLDGGAGGRDNLAIEDVAGSGTTKTRLISVPT